jgi:predicted enzyme related to lactoylglutathione lyase
MIAGKPVTTILPVTNLARARRFYEEQLGLGPGRDGPVGEVLFESGGGRIALSPRETPTKAEHTVMSFEVSDIGTEVKDLERRGVRFEDYDLPNLKTVGHICDLGAEKAAWFKDTEGNILCIHESKGIH